MAYTIEEIKEGLNEQHYFPTQEIACAVAGAVNCRFPLLIEGAPGAGKTSLAKAVAGFTGRDLLRVQFYEGVTEDRILYDYDYQKQLLTLESIRSMLHDELKGKDINEAISYITENVDFYGENFLLARPVLEALLHYKRTGRDCVLLLDEIEKAPEEIEYTLLQVLDEYAVTVPQYGTIKSEPGHEPIVFLTSNRYRELSDALKRRCNYIYIKNKTAKEILHILNQQAEIDPVIARGVAHCMVQLQNVKLKQQPSISEAMSWGKFLTMQFGGTPSEEDLRMSAGMLLKNKDDVDRLRGAQSSMFQEFQLGNRQSL